MINPKVFNGRLSKSGPVWVGIDQSYTGFGLTLIDADGGYLTYVYQSPGKGIERLVSIEEWLGGVLRGYDARIKDVAIESPVLKSPSALMSGQLYSMVLRLLWVDFGIKPVQVPPTTLKKYACGKGGGVSKALVLMNVYKNWGVEFTDDNAADSFVLARIAAQRFENSHQRDAVNLLQQAKFREG